MSLDFGACACENFAIESQVEMNALLLLPLLLQACLASQAEESAFCRLCSCESSSKAQAQLQWMRVEEWMERWSVGLGSSFSPPAQRGGEWEKEEEVTGRVLSHMCEHT
ncbi:hypothetical protein SRHO_G00170310 [Serrasalmus rhombeus]